jgi:hypothetical protein
MRRILASFLIVSSAFCTSALSETIKPPPDTSVTALAGPPAPNTLQNGTAVKLRRVENLTSATAKARIMEA